jgi:hypothetical protein
MGSLYHLTPDGTGASAASRQELGPLPHTSVVLLTSLVCAWVLIGTYVVFRELRKKSKNRKG